jgi:hypothetical protein
MNNVFTRTYEMFLRVQTFTSERASSFPHGTLGAGMCEEINAVVQALGEAIASQTSGLNSAQQATAAREAARQALRADVQAITRTARAMALDAPGLENKFRLPRSGSDQALLAAARAFATDAVPYKAEFVRHELPESFIEDLRAHTADLERAMGEQNTGRGAHVTATASIESVIERGMNAMRKLDTIVRNKLRDDHATLAAWESARHVESATRTRKRSNGNAGGSDGEPGKKD